MQIILKMSTSIFYYEETTDKHVRAREGRCQRL